MSHLTIRKERSKTAGILLEVLGAVLLVALWWILSALIGKEVILPSPVRVVSRLGTLALQKDFLLSVLLSLLRISLGYVAGVIVGTAFAILSSAFFTFDKTTSPLGTVIKATPVASFIILALVFLDANAVPSFITFLIVLPIVWNGLRAGILSSDPELLEMCRHYGMKPITRLRYFWLPSVREQYISALSTSLGIAWKAGIAAEVLCDPKHSIGGGIYESKLYLETADLFAYTLTVVILSLILEFLIKKLLKGRRSV